MSVTARGPWCVVPVKAFHAAKQRLGPVHGAEFRRALARAMLEDVLAAATAVNALGGVAVVTADPEVRSLAGGFGVRLLEEPRAEVGLSAAVAAAARRLAAEDCRAMLVLPADIPGVTPADIRSLLDGHPPAPGLTIVPDRDGDGTNAILASPPDALPFAYGPNSFSRHVAGARQAGCTVRVVTSPAIGFDLDHPADLSAFARTPSPTRTWRFLQTPGLGAGALFADSAGNASIAEFRP